MISELENFGKQEIAEMPSNVLTRSTKPKTSASSSIDPKITGQSPNMAVSI